MNTSRLSATRSCFVALLAVFVLAECAAGQAPDACQWYLRTVYPTSDAVRDLSPETARSFYEGLRFWYRVPSDQYPDGLFSRAIKPTAGVFMVPSTVAVNTNLPAQIQDQGFTTDEVVHGSNQNHIEISTFGWMMFPYGAYYNYAPGTGIYLETGGRTMQGYTKIHVLYKLYQNDLETYYNRLADNEMVLGQILGTQDPLTEAGLQQLLEDPAAYLQGKNAPNLISCLLASDQWAPIAAKLRLRRTAQAAFRDLLEVYVGDHVAGRFNPLEARYAYFKKEASVGVDQWAYEACKQAGLNVIQTTREPNNNGGTSFELFDTRWPEVFIKDAGNKALIEGMQSYSILFVWQKAVANGWYQQRDPLDLENVARARVVKPLFPEMDRSQCGSGACAIVRPSDRFDRSWLPGGRWDEQQCALLGCLPSTTVARWKQPRPCPPGLVLAGEDTCLLTDFALNAVGNGSLSVVDIARNRLLYQQRAQQ